MNGVLYFLGGAVLIAAGAFLQLWLDHLQQRAWEARHRSAVTPTDRQGVERGEGGEWDPVREADLARLKANLQPYVALANRYHRMLTYMPDRD